MYKLAGLRRQTNRRVVDDDKFRAAVADGLANLFARKGLLFLGFAAFRGTAAFAENLIAYTFGIGIKIFLLYLVVGLGSQIAISWIPLIQSSTFFGPASPLLQIVGGAIIFAVLAIRVPNAVASRLSGSSSFGIAAALRAVG